MTTTTFNTNGLENEGFRELTAVEMADVQGGTAVEYAINLALIAVEWIMFVQRPLM